MEMPAIKLDNGTVEALKWIGLLAMTGDHVNKYLFNATLRCCLSWVAWRYRYLYS